MLNPPEGISLVSILVLVDLAHEFEFRTIEEFIFQRFNPCFSGSCSRILLSRTLQLCTRVSILVLVDLAHECESLVYTTDIISFNPCFSGSCSRIRRLGYSGKWKHVVSILVLVDLAHEYSLPLTNAPSCTSFNPCFSGSCSRIGIELNTMVSELGFNPCFSGSCSRISLPVQLHSS